MLFSNPGGFATQGAFDDSTFQQTQALSFQNFALSQDELFNFREFSQVSAMRFRLPPPAFCLLKFTLGTFNRCP